MKLITISFLCLFLTISFLKCSDDPVTIKNERNFNVEIIPAGEVIIEWDSTIYQHNRNWNSPIDSLIADSIANVLNKSELLVEEMWYPSTSYDICGIPLIPGKEIIVRLNKPDTAIYKFGFEANDAIYPLVCFPEWRHYIFKN